MIFEMFVKRNYFITFDKGNCEFSVHSFYGTHRSCVKYAKAVGKRFENNGFKIIRAIV